MITFTTLQNDMRKYLTKLLSLRACSKMQLVEKVSPPFLDHRHLRAQEVHNHLYHQHDHTHYRNNHHHHHHLYHHHHTNWSQVSLISSSSFSSLIFSLSEVSFTLSILSFMAGTFSARHCELIHTTIKKIVNFIYRDHQNNTFTIIFMYVIKNPLINSLYIIS